MTWKGAHRRREGFPGQRHVILPLPVVTAALEHPLLAGLLPAAVGYFPRAEGHEVEREGSLKETILILCTSGRGWVRLREQERRVVPGDLLVVPPNVPHAYGSLDEDPWSISWVHLLGGETHEILALLGLSEGSPVVHVSPQSAQGANFTPACAALETGYGLGELLAASAVLRVTTANLYRASLRASRGKRSHASRIERTIEWMAAHANRAARLPELAEVAGMSVPHFCTVFRRQTGYPPAEYFGRMKVQLACQLLDTTSMLVREVAAAVGYDDPYYFSRLFRKVMGRSPQQYRHLVKG